MKSSSLLIAVSWSAITLVPISAKAQSADVQIESGASGLQEIVVTAQRRSENLQTHHVHILELNGDSFRLASSRKRQKDKGVAK